ncbi:MAG TPA: TolC family protein, partial [Rhodothermales bacterium]|nr:TolC family protein [Rhodothermales bacterium]
LALLMLVGVPVRAQDVRTLTLAEVVDRARTAATPVQAAGLDVRDRAASVAAARAAYLPEVSAYASGAQRYGLAFDQTAGRLTQAATQAMSVGTEVSYPLFDGFTRAAALARSRADLAGAELTATHARQQATADALRAAYTLAADESAVALAEAQVEAARRQAALVEAQIDAGRRPATERLQAAERVAAAELAVLEARRVQQRSTLALVRLLALDPATRYRFEPPTPDSSAFISDEAIAALVGEALSRRADLRALDAATEAAAAQQRAVRAGTLPTVAVVGGYGTSFTSTGEGAFGSQLGQNRGGSLGLRVGMPLLNQRRTRAEAAAAEARTARARLDVEDRRREIETEVRGALADGQVLVQTLDVAHRRVAAAALAVEAETARYNAGTTTLADLAEVQARYAQAVATRDRARLDLAFQHTLLAFLTGTL